MRIKFTLVLTILLIASVPFGPVAQSTEDSLPPAPTFQTLDNRGTPDGSHIYENNTAITISYKADRFDVEGLILLGSGSNLTENLNNREYLQNFTKISSLKANSFYEIEINVTSYTYFYAYAWYGTFSNGTQEEFDLIGDSPGHELWIEEGTLYPTLDVDSTTAEQRDGSFYTPLNSEVTITYQVRDNEDNIDDSVTLAFAENSSSIYNESTALNWVDMTKVNYTQIGDFQFSIFEYNLTLTEPILYFTAMNDHGWERSDATTPEIHRITNGFSFNETFSESLDLYTTLDDIEFNITTYNETDDMSVGYQYRYFANASSDEPLVNWTTVDDISNITIDYVNSTVGDTDGINSTLKKIYNGTLATDFNASNVVELQTFVRYGSGSNITSGVYEITILDPSPLLDITSKNNTVTRRGTAVVKFDYSTPKGDIDTAQITHTLPSGDVKPLINIKGKINATISFVISSTNDTVLEGNHTLFVNVTNSLGVSTSTTIIYHIDQTAPVGNVRITQPSTSTTSLTGEVRVSFSTDDLGIAPSGVSYITLNWGNNMTINATGLSEASIKYRRSGEFTITLTVYDKAGNSFSNSTIITVNLPAITNNTDNGRNSIPIITVFSGIFVLASISFIKRRGLIST